MTRDQAKEQATVTRYSTVYDGNSSLNNPKFSLIDEIYDDFESRTCEHCKHSYGNHPDTKACDVIHGWIPKDFGCNEFKRKEL